MYTYASLASNKNKFKKRSTEKINKKKCVIMTCWLTGALTLTYSNVKA